MPSPVTGDSFVIASPGANLCAKFSNLLNLAKVMKSFFDWGFSATGTVENPFKALMLPPQNTIWTFYSTDTDPVAVAAVVEMWYRDVGDTGDPFFRLCDGNNGTPNLIGKTLVGAGTAGTGTVFAAAAAGGAETATLTVDQLPAHTHDVPYTVDGVGGGGAQSPNEGYMANDPPGGTPRANQTSSSVGSGEGHPNMPPFMPIYYVIRTSRVS